MKNTYLKIFVFIYLQALMCGNLTNAQSATQTTTTGHIFAEVIPVFSASETSQLFFGKFSPGPQGGEITLTPENTLSVLGSVFTGTGTHNAATFYITGDNDAMFSITLPSEPAKLTNTENAKTMLVDNWISVPGPGVGTGKLENGCQTVKVGATLNISTINENPPGIYTGTYTITFDFN